MTSKILFCFLLGAAAAAPQGYNLPTPNNPLQTGGGQFGSIDINGGDSFVNSFDGGFDVNSGGLGGGFGDISNGYTDSTDNGGSFVVTDGGNFEGDIGGGFGGNLDNSFGGDFRNSDGGSFDSSLGGDFGNSDGGSFDSSLGGDFGNSNGGSFDSSFGGDFGNSNGGSFGGDIGNSLGGGFESSFGGNSVGSIGATNGGDFANVITNGNNGGFVDVSGGLNGGNSGTDNRDDGPCGNGQVRNARGICVIPMISRNIFVFAAPKVQRAPRGSAPQLPKPKVEYNLVFVRTPEGTLRAEPIVVPPPQQKTLVYVLSKTQEASAQRVIEVPAGPVQQPEVYYVNYDENENPTLPGGVDLQTALNAAGQTGQVLDGGNSAAGSGNQGETAGSFNVGASSGTSGSFSGTNFGSDTGNNQDITSSTSSGIQAGGEYADNFQNNSGGNLSGATNGFGGSIISTPSQLYQAV